MGDLDDRVAVVTGSARGLGRASALKMASEGADLALVDLASESSSGPLSGIGTSTELAEVVGAIQSMGRRALPITADVTVAGDCQRMADQVLAEFGKIDILFANAGIAGAGGSAWALSESQFDRVFAVDVKGVWLTTKYLVPHMIEQGSGKIIITSSRSGVRAEEGCAHYIAAKHAVVGFAKALAMELGPYEINVNAICPSGMGKISEDDYDPTQWGPPLIPFAPSTAQDFDRLYGKLNLFESVGRAEFDEVAEAVLWLASDRSRLMTGTTFLMDAGYVAKRGG